MNPKLKELIILMREFVRNKHPEWKSAEGSFRVNDKQYNWKIEKK